MSSIAHVPDIGDTLTVPAEPLTVHQAQAIARDVYGLHATARVLTSERDQNFLLSEASGRAYVLKATHPAEDPAVTDFQTKVQLHLMQPRYALAVPHLVSTRAGASVHWFADGGATPRAIRLITFLHGVPMSQTVATPNQQSSLGASLARFDEALQNFHHPQADHVLLWDIQHAGRLRELLSFVEGCERRALVEQTMQRFQEQVLPALASLRRQVIHNDLNRYNVMVDAAYNDRITGILDFGDMVYAPLVQDLAVACSYQLDDPTHVLHGAARCVQSFHAVTALTGPELDVLPDLIAARLMVTVIITGWRARQYPANSAYILRNNPLSWRGLQRLALLGQGEAQHLFRTVSENALRSAT